MMSRFPLLFRLRELRIMRHVRAVLNESFARSPLPKRRGQVWRTALQACRMESRRFVCRGAAGFPIRRDRIALMQHAVWRAQPTGKAEHTGFITLCVGLLGK